MLRVLESGAGARDLGESGRAEYQALLRRLGPEVFETFSQPWTELHLAAIGAAREAVRSHDVTDELKQKSAMALFRVVFPLAWRFKDRMDRPLVRAIREAALAALVTGPVLQQLPGRERAQAQELGVAAGLVQQVAVGGVEPAPLPAEWALDRTERLFATASAVEVLPAAFRARLQAELAERAVAVARGWTADPPAVPSDDDVKAVELASKSQVFGGLPPNLKVDLADALDAVAEAEETRARRRTKAEEQRANRLEIVCISAFARRHVMRALEVARRPRAAKRLFDLAFGPLAPVPDPPERQGLWTLDYTELTTKRHVWNVMALELRRAIVERLLGQMEQAMASPDVEEEGGHPWSYRAEKIVARLRRAVLAEMAAAEYRDRAMDDLRRMADMGGSIACGKTRDGRRFSHTYRYGEYAQAAIAAIERASAMQRGKKRPWLARLSTKKPAPDG